MRRFFFASLGGLLLAATISVAAPRSADAWCWWNCSYTKTKYPIVLAHGFLGFEQILGIDYWYGIPSSLESGGAKVFVTQVSQVNSSEVRGEQLIAQIEDILAITGKSKVNLIGHSQGGLDIRYVAAVRPDLVASITTVATPHYGADIAGTFDPNSTLGRLFSQVLGTLGDLIAWLSGSDLPNDMDNAFAAFSPDGIAVFNAKYPNGLPATYCGQGASVANGIRNYSWSGTGTITTGIDPSDALFALTSLFYDEANDGLVERCGSHFGKVLRDNYFYNHLDEVNMFFGLVSPFEANPKSVYRAHANRLKHAGL